MDKLTQYRQIVERIVKEYASYKPSYGQVEMEAIIDRESDHYEVMQVGWNKVRRVHGAVIHLDIVDGKIWIQYDGTNRPVADELLSAGVPKEDIVLGFHPAELWQHTGYGVPSPTATPFG
jgi:hypothetical protein